MSHSHGEHAHGRHGGPTDDDPERIMPGTRLWDELYPEHLQRYEHAGRHLKPGMRVLDAGCGVGYGSAYLADLGASRVAAVDIAPEAIAEGRAHFDRPNVSWFLEDCQKLDQAAALGPFDLVCNLENIEHLPDPDAFLARIASLLVPGGTVIVSSPNRVAMNRLRGVGRDFKTTNPHHFHEFTGPEFQAFLEQHFEHVDLAYQSWDPAERMALEPVLSALWTNPFMRAGRWLQRTLRGRPAVERIEDLLPPRGYRIYASDPGADLALTILATCRGPRARAV